MTTIDRSESQIVPTEQAPLARVEPSIMDVISQAVASGRPTAELTELFALYERMNAAKAKAEFNRALTAFKADRPPVVRRTENSQFKVNRNGQMVNRRYASLEDIDKAIGATLAKHGLSYGWGDAKVENGYLSIPCIVSHQNGHSISAMSMPVQIESRAGASDQQKVGIAQTYAMRYSLKAALGLTDVDEDDTDGNEPPGEQITEHQAANLDTLIENVGADKARFLKWAKIEKIGDLPASRFAEAVAMLERKRK